MTTQEAKLRLDLKTAGALLSHAGKFKPKGFSRAMKMNESFELLPDSATELPLIGNAGDYLVLTPEGKITVEMADFIDYHFEPVKTRTRKNVPKA